MADNIIRAFVAKQKELLDLELQASNEEERDFLLMSSSKSRKSDNDNERDRKEDLYSHVLAHLEASDISVGMYGKTVVQLTVWSQVSAADSSSNDKTGNRSRLLPAHRFTVGDEVEIRAKGKGQSNSVAGVINAVSDTFVSVALFPDRKSSSAKHSSKQPSKSSKQEKSANATQDDTNETDLFSMAPLTLVPKSSVEVHKKLVDALTTLEKYGVDHPIAGSVIKAMFLEDKESNWNSSTTHRSKMEPFNPNLDQSQLEAIQFALQPDRPFSLIHGPPGTGKTTTIAELIQQAVYHHGMRVLVTAPSNVAVDNVLERLVAIEDSAARKDNSFRKKKRFPLKTIRLGHPARIKTSILTHSLEHLVQTSEGTEIVRDVRDELQTFLKVLANPKSRGQDKKAAYRQINELRKEVRVREEKVVQELINSANVVLATTVGAGGRILDKFNDDQKTNLTGFDLVVIDEAAQALEASCWIPILRGRKVVLAGDHKQLPPTIKSKDRRAVDGLSNTLFERLLKLYKNDEKRISRMLQIQYRMNHNIADWASQAMYHGELLSHESVRDRTLGQLPMVQRTSSQICGPALGDVPIDTTLLLVDTAGCDMFEMETAAGSRFNEGEALIVNQHVRQLLLCGVDQGQIAIITPYNGQVELLRSMLLPDFPKLEIRSVDGFQGGEREAVVLSLVRSSERGGQNGIGFLRDDRRQNVAITRAKRQLTLVCDTETVSQSSFISNLIGWIEEHGEQRSAMEYVSDNTGLSDQAHIRKVEADFLKLIEPSSGPSKKSLNALNVAGIDSNYRSPKDDNRKLLMDRITELSESGNDGEEMTLSSELSSYDRRLVHELAEQLGLAHRSEGVEGFDRRIILTVKKQITTLADNNEERVDASETTIPFTLLEKSDENGQIQASNFSALALGENDSETEEETNSAIKVCLAEDRAIEHSSVQIQVPEANSLLAQLAKERAVRQNQKQSSLQCAGTVSKISGRKKKNKGYCLGGTATRKSTSDKEELLQDLDEMAFLDAQIKIAENAHGRKVVGSGMQYKTIVNGILNARPEPKSKPVNMQANASLQAKLREAESSRKKKSKKKK